MYGGCAKRFRPHINGKSRNEQARSRFSAENTISHASLHHAVSFRLVLSSELEAAPEISHRGILELDTPINWIDTSEMDFHEEFVGESFGRINKPEANLLLQELENYIRKIGENRVAEECIDFGLISPYKAQVQYLRNKIKGNPFFRPYRNRITVNTVDGFQGQERDVIFISLVRANENGQIGFLNDLRRMNVAITRARMKLVILGDATTMSKHSFYRKFIEYINGLRQNS